MIGPTNALTVTGTIDPQGVTVGSDTKPVKIVNGVATMVANDLVSTVGDSQINGIIRLYTTEQTRLEIKSARTGATQPIGGIQFQNSSGSAVSFLYSRVNGETGVQLLGSTKAFFVLDQRNYDATNTNDVVTVGTLQSSSDVVHTAGNETVNGIKTFSSVPKSPENIKSTKGVLIDGFQTTTHPTGWYRIYSTDSGNSRQYLHVILNAWANNNYNLGYAELWVFSQNANNTPIVRISRKGGISASDIRVTRTATTIMIWLYNPIYRYISVEIERTARFGNYGTTDDWTVVYTGTVEAEPSTADYIDVITPTEW